MWVQKIRSLRSEARRLIKGLYVIGFLVSRITGNRIDFLGLCGTAGHNCCTACDGAKSSEFQEATTIGLNLFRLDCHSSLRSAAVYFLHQEPGAGSFTPRNGILYAALHFERGFFYLHENLSHPCYRFVEARGFRILDIPVKMGHPGIEVVFEKLFLV